MNSSFRLPKREKRPFSFSLGPPRAHTYSRPLTPVAQLGSPRAGRDSPTWCPVPGDQQVSSNTSTERSGETQRPASSRSAGQSPQGPNEVVGPLMAETKGALGTILSDSLVYR